MRRAISPAILAHLAEIRTRRNMAAQVENFARVEEKHGCYQPLALVLQHGYDGRGFPEDRRCPLPAAPRLEIDPFAVDGIA